MSFAPIHEIGMQWGGLLTSRTDIVRPERSLARTIFFAIIVVAFLVLELVILLNPDTAIAAVSRDTGRRNGFAVIGLFVVPLLFAALGVVGLIWWSRTWRVPGGGKLVDAISIDFSRTDPQRVWHVLETATSADDPGLTALIAELRSESGQPRSPYQLWVKHSPADRLMVGLVARQLPKKESDPQGGLRSQLDREPVVRRDERYIDLSQFA